MLFTLFHSRLANHTLLHWFLSSLSKLRWNIFLTNMIQRRFEQICLGHYWIRTDNLLEDPPTPSLSGSWQMAEPPDNSQKLLSTHIFWRRAYILLFFWILFGFMAINQIEIFFIKIFLRNCSLLTSSDVHQIYFTILLDTFGIYGNQSNRNIFKIFLRNCSLLTSSDVQHMLLLFFWILFEFMAINQIL